MPPIALLREHLQQWNLLRKYKGRLQPSPAARKTYDDDARLWGYLADRLANQENIALRVGMEAMVGWRLADQQVPFSQRGHAMVSVLFHAGLRPAGGGELTEQDGEDVYAELRRQLNSLGIFEGDRFLGGRELTPGGLKFLRELQAPLRGGQSLVRGKLRRRVAGRQRSRATRRRTWFLAGSTAGRRPARRHRSGRPVRRCPCPRRGR